MEVMAVMAVMAAILNNRHRARNTLPTDIAHRRRRTWILIFAALFAMEPAWALATPVFSVPAEPAHVVKAADVVRGQLTGRNNHTSGSRLTQVDLPRQL